ncbi:MAG: hypothetical protein H7X93_14925 [Sphingomonadaceae bacterium]|nr:hypothetical protein [Sphingomonadaceae bacterium]
MTSDGSITATLVSTIVDFEDLGLQFLSEPDIYRGMDWSDFAVNSLVFSPGGGFTPGTTSGENSAFNYYARDTEITDATNFNFRSAQLTGGWNNGLQVTISGYDDGVLEYSVTVTVNADAPTFFTFDFLDIDRLTFHSEGGVRADPDSAGQGTHFVIDDMAFDVAPAAISGSVWNDADGDGTHDAGEAGLAGRTVILDDDGDGMLDAGETFAVTGGDGGYAFAGVAPGEHRVTQVLPQGWVARGETGPVGFYIDSGETGRADFLAAERAAIVGTIDGILFHDENRDGLRGVDEAGIEGWRVYLDDNGNGRLDAGEASTFTDEAGAYGLSDVLPGAVTVRVETPASGWENWWAPPTGIALAAGASATADLAVTGGATRYDDAIYATGSADDVIHALAGDDLVVAGPGEDRLYGNAGDDRLRGRDDDDALRGGAGSDRVVGGRGDDTLSGGAGADMFKFGGPSGRDVVTDFDAAEGDRLRIDVFGLDDLTIVGRDGGAAISWGAANEVFLRGVDPETLTEDVFVFDEPILAALPSLALTEMFAGVF